MSGKQRIHELWPNLRLFIHGAVSFDPYREQFHKLFPHPDMTYLETYNASEGFSVSGPRGTKRPAAVFGLRHLLRIRGGGRSRKPHHIVRLEDVEVGKNYAMIISTNSGLWRYMIGDTVKFTSRRRTASKSRAVRNTSSTRLAKS